MRKLPPAPPCYRFTIVSTCPEPWGGSEELWWGSACALMSDGHDVAVLKTRINPSHPRIEKLNSLGCPVWDLEKVWKLPNAFNALLPSRVQLTPLRKQRFFLKRQLKKQRPDLVIISQGENRDGLAFAQLCRSMRQPYVLIAQKAIDWGWPSDRTRTETRKNYQGALKCFFVSQHNQRLTEDQIGVSLPQAKVVRNPFLVSPPAPLPWPRDERLKLACVGRLYLPDKGQDVLLRVLSLEKWRQRPLHVSFFGQGTHRDGLIEFAARLGVERVSFEGHVEDVTNIWKEHHALVLPSRSEGLPLALVEAMMCGRTAIVTNVGGNAEILEDGTTGFVAAGAVEVMMDEALERAWNRRQEWKAMGELAASRVREVIPLDPAREFANQLLDLASSTR